MMNNPVGSYKGTSHWLNVPIKLSTHLLHSETKYLLMSFDRSQPDTYSFNYSTVKKNQW